MNALYGKMDNSMDTKIDQVTAWSINVKNGHVSERKVLPISLPKPK